MVLLEKYHDKCDKWCYRILEGKHRKCYRKDNDQEDTKSSKQRHKHRRSSEPLPPGHMSVRGGTKNFEHGPVDPKQIAAFPHPAPLPAFSRGMNGGMGVPGQGGWGPVGRPNMWQNQGLSSMKPARLVSVPQFAPHVPAPAQTPYQQPPQAQQPFHPEKSKSPKVARAGLMSPKMTPSMKNIRMPTTGMAYNPRGSGGSTQSIASPQRLKATNFDIGNNDRTFIEGMVPVESTTMRGKGCETRVFGNSAMSVISPRRLATTNFDIGNNDRTFIEGMGPNDDDNSSVASWARSRR